MCGLCFLKSFALKDVVMMLITYHMCSSPFVCIALDSIFAIPKDALLIKLSSFSYMYIYVKDTESESEQSSDHSFRTCFFQRAEDYQ